MEDIQCIFCNEGSSRIAIQENGYMGRKCSGCGLIYVSPRPTYAEVQNLYIQDQAHMAAETHIKADYGQRLIAKHNLKIIKKYSTPVKIKIW